MLRMLSENMPPNAISDSDWINKSLHLKVIENIGGFHTLSLCPILETASEVITFIAYILLNSAFCYNLRFF